jgi:dephospho-CoA kinase
MLKIGITGGIGSGKTLICKIFLVLGVPVYNADYEASRLLDQHDVVQKLVASFGKRISNKGRVDRKALAEVVFNNNEALGLLNSIVHPLVRKDFTLWLDGRGEYPYVIKESAILFETGIYRELDAVILVSAPEELRLKRAMKRDNASEESIRKRMANQWTDESREALTELVLRNDNNNPVLPVVLRLHQEFSRGEIPAAI